MWHPFRDNISRQPAVAPPRSAYSVEQFRSPVTRRPWKARRDARRTVRAGLPLQEYLEARMGIYNRQTPQMRLPLPAWLGILEGQIVRTTNPAAAEDPRLRLLNDPAGALEADDTLSFAQELEALRALNRTRAEAVLRDLGEQETQIGRLTARLTEVRETREDRETERLQAIQDGASALEATLGRPAEGRGKPMLDPARPVTLGYALMAGLILGEAWQYFSPFADLTGVDPTDPLRTPLGAIGAAAFAAGTSFVSVVLPKRMLSKWKTLKKEAQTLRQQAFGWLEVVGCGALYTLITVALGAVRHTGGEGARGLEAALQGAQPAAGAAMSWWILPGINFVLPIGLALFWQWKVEGSQERLRQQREARWRWDAEENIRIEASERQDAAIERLRAEEQALERAREDARNALQRIAAEAQAAEADVRAALEQERRFNAAWLNAVEAALHQDRLAFVERARRKERYDLLGEALETAAVHVAAGPQNGAMHRQAEVKDA